MIRAREASGGQAKRKRVAAGADIADGDAAQQAYAEVCRTCRCAQAPADLAAQWPGRLFWALPYDPTDTNPQLVVSVERYVLPDRTLRHTVFNDAGFLARVVHQQVPLISTVEHAPPGLVLVKPVHNEGFLRMTWPTELIGPTLDELLGRSRPCNPTDPLWTSEDDGHSDDVSCLAPFAYPLFICF